jgi:hypothetical protein
MQTATTIAAAGLRGVISIHRVRPEGWRGPTCALLGQGPWLPAAWPRQPNMPPLALAYRLHLDGLDAARLWLRLHELADGYEPVLVNDAEPRLPNLMVRRMVATWFERELGEDVPELGRPQLGLVAAIGIDAWAS